MKARTSARVSAPILPSGKACAASASRPSSDSGPSSLTFSQPPAASCSKALIRPSAARRRPNGSRSPVGARPMLQMPTRVSMRSAMNSVAAVSVAASTGAS
ncbi:Uncharacterised protein [Bordetella pertussis]|nr:Uncharacterised protein [Bordetella pertussis]